MVTVETIAKVRRLHFVEGKGIKRICRETGLARETVRVIVRAGLDGPTARRYARREQPLPQIGAHAEALDRLLAENVKQPKREQLTFQRIFEELRLTGYAGGYDAVRRYGRAWERREGERTAAAFVPLSFASGEAYQFDWSHEVVLLDHAQHGSAMTGWPRR